MAKIPVEIKINAVDGASGALDALRLRLAGVSEQIKQMKSRMEPLKDLTSTMRSVGNGISNVGKGLTLGVTAPLAGFAALSLKSAAGFETTMLRLQAATDAPAEGMKALKNEALRIGTTTQFAGSQAAAAMVELGKAGFSVEQIMTSTKDVVNLAGAEMMAMDEAATIVSDTMNQFGLAAKDTARITDVLAYAAGKSTTDVKGLAEGLKMAGGMARSSGISLEETNAVLATMANLGIKGTMSGTSLASALSRIQVNPKAYETLRSMGVGFDDLFSGMKDGRLQFKSFADILEVFEKKGINDSQIFQVFGEEASRSMKQLIGKSKEVRALREEMTKGAAVGFASKQNEVKSSGFEAQLAKLKGTLEALMIGEAGAEGTGLLGMATEGIKKLTEAVKWFQALSPETKKAIFVVAGIAAAVGPVLIVLGSLVSTVASLISVWTALGTGTLGVAFVGALPAILAVGAALAAVGYAVYQIYQHFDGLGDFFASVFEYPLEFIEALVEAITGAATSVADSISSVANWIGGPIGLILNALMWPIQKLDEFITKTRGLLGLRDAITAPSSDASPTSVAMGMPAMGMGMPVMAPVQASQNKVVVDFQNMPKGVRVVQDSRGSEGLDLSMGYAMVTP